MRRAAQPPVAQPDAMKTFVVTRPAGRVTAMLQLLRSWLTPAPDSRVAAIQRQGKSVWAEGVHLLWSVWVFITPAMGSHSALRGVLLTLLSYPLFLLMFAKSMLASRRVAPRYALGLVAMSIALAPWYPSGMAYFIYGCVSYSMASAKRVGPLLLRSEERR